MMYKAASSKGATLNRSSRGVAFKSHAPTLSRGIIRCSATETPKGSPSNVAKAAFAAAAALLLNLGGPVADVKAISPAPVGSGGGFVDEGTNVNRGVQGGRRQAAVNAAEKASQPTNTRKSPMVPSATRQTGQPGSLKGLVKGPAQILGEQSPKPARVKALEDRPELIKEQQGYLQSAITPTIDPK